MIRCNHMSDALGRMRMEVTVISFKEPSRLEGLKNCLFKRLGNFI